MTKPTGVGRGGKRAGAGRKPAPSDLPGIQTAGLSPDEVMELAMHGLAAAGRLDAASKAAARLIAARRAATSAPGKKQQAQATAREATQPGGRFAPRPPPGALKPN